MKSVIVGLTSLVLAGAASSGAFAAGGALDALDPCIKQTNMFKDNRSSIIKKLDENIIEAEKAPTPADYRANWFESKRKDLRPIFDETVLPSLKEVGISSDTEIVKMYNSWFDRQVAAIGGENVNKLVDDSFHHEFKRYRIEQSKSTQENIEQQKRELDKSCKNDVGSQVLRGTLAAVLAPVAMASRNLELAKRESGFVAKLIAAPTGISIDAINKNGGVFGGGLSGGENSFFRKNLGIRF